MSMVHVTVRLGDPLWQQAGKKEITVSLTLGATEADLVDALVDLYPGLSWFFTDAEILGRLGTHFLYQDSNRLGAIRTRNSQENFFEDSLNGEDIKRNVQRIT